MPTYLLHGFRWPRPLIRIHIILQNLDDAAAEWLMAPATTATLLANFRTLYPTLMPALPGLRFIEQYDPLDESVPSQPFAYVADTVHEIPLGLDVDEVRGAGVRQEAWDAMKELRDRIAPGEKLAWFVVVCGDTERWAPPTVGLLEGSVAVGSRGGSRSGSGSGSGSSDGGKRPSTPNRGSFRKWLFGKADGNLRKKKSTLNLQNGTTDGSRSEETSTPPPPVPPLKDHPQHGHGTAV